MRGQFRRRLRHTVCMNSIDRSTDTTVAEVRVPLQAIKGRGTARFFAHRFEKDARESFDDGWEPADGDAPPPRTEVIWENARSIIAGNDSPDIYFNRSINPYRGCEHGCIYCYARPTHSYLNLSPGLDFETKIFYKPDAAALLDAELRKPGYVCESIHIGGNTDPYQPVERELRITRAILETLIRFRHPFSLITKGAALTLRDMDLFEEAGRLGLASIAVSITSLDDALKRTLEPRTSSPAARLKLIRRLADAGVPVTVMAAPLIPFVNDAELEAILEAARDAGAVAAGYVMLRLPFEVKQLFREWLDVHVPLKARHVMSLVQQMHGGKDYDSRWGTRQSGTGEYAELVAKRFALACRRLGLNEGRKNIEDTSRFQVPPARGDQMGLF